MGGKENLFACELDVERGENNGECQQGRKRVLIVHYETVWADAAKLEHNVFVVVWMDDLKVLDAGHCNTATKIEHIRLAFYSA